jgi:chaperonin GroES
MACQIDSVAVILHNGTRFAGGFSNRRTKNHCIMAQKNLRPISDRVVIKPAAAEEKTSGGIIIPDTAKEQPQRGEVIAVGPGKDGNLMTVQKGDTVLYGKYAGQKVDFEGEEFLIMREEDILVVLD